jgi:hypothetical protein
MRILLILICLFFGASVHAQTQAEVVANKIAQKMKDSLNLADSVRIKIYQINMQLDQQKLVVRNHYAGSDSLRIKVQQVENSRDALYQAVLPGEKFVLYRQKKRNLVNNN